MGAYLLTHGHVDHVSALAELCRSIEGIDCESFPSHEMADLKALAGELAAEVWISAGTSEEGAAEVPAGYEKSVVMVLAVQNLLLAGIIYGDAPVREPDLGFSGYSSFLPGYFPQVYTLCAIRRAPGAECK